MVMGVGMGSVVRSEIGREGIDWKILRILFAC
jgi:hypothetical protein